MRTERLECVTPDTIRDHLRSMVAEHGRTTKSEEHIGGLSRVAELIGDVHPTISSILRNVQSPSKKVLDCLGLKKVVVYVKSGKQSEGGSE